MKTLLVTRPRAQAQAFIDALDAPDWAVACVQMIEITPLAPSRCHPPLASDPFQWVLFTSAQAVYALLGDDASTSETFLSAIGTAKFAAVGPATAEALSARQRTVAFMPRSYSALDAAREFSAAYPAPPALRLLWPCSALSSTDEIRQEMALAGHTLLPWPVYETRTRTGFEDADLTILNSPMHLIAFTSPSCVDALSQAVPLSPQAILAAIGPATARRVLQRYERCDIVAKTHTLKGLAEAVSAWLTRLASGPP